MTKLGNEVASAIEDEVRRPDFGLRVIIIWKVVKGALLIALGITALVLRHHDLHALGVDVVAWLGIDPARPSVEKMLDKLLSLTPGKVAGLGIGAFAIAAVMLVEAWGLHRRRVWAEWLTVVVTASFIPFEIHHLAARPTVGRVITLVVNVAIVIYLLRHRWLFLPGRIGRWWKRRRNQK